MFIGGYGQGATLALHYAMSCSNIPAGVISVNGYLLKNTNVVNGGKLPVLLLQSGETVVSENEARQSFGRLLESGS